MDPDRKQLAAGLITLIFLSGTLTAYSYYNANLDVEMEAANFTGVNEEPGYQKLDLEVKNKENTDITPEIYFIGPKDSGPLPLKILNSEKLIEPGETRTLHLETESNNIYIPSEDNINFMLILKDQNGRYQTLMDYKERIGFSNNHFYTRDDFTNWIELSTNPENFELDKKGYGVESEFDGCSSRKRCEVLLYQRAQPEKYVEISFKTSNMTNKTRIGLMLERDEDKFKKEFDLSTSENDGLRNKTFSIPEVYEEAGWAYSQEFLDVGVFIISTEPEPHRVNISEINSFRTR